MSRTIHLYNGKIFTNPINSEFCDAITIEDGVVCAHNQECPQSVLSIDLQGAFAFPGFIDSHMHLVHSSSGLGVDLSSCSSRSEFEEVLLRESEAQEKSAWLLGSGWDEQLLGEEPDMSWLSSADVPALFYRVDFHTAILNAQLLDLLDVARLAKMPGGNRILDGVVMEDVLFNEVIPLIPELSYESKIIKVQRSIEYLHKNGITSVGTMESMADVLHVLQSVRESKNMRCFVICLDEPDEEFAQACAELHEDSFLKVIGLKTFIDGSLGSRTAKMYEDWCDTKGNGVWAGHTAKGELEIWMDKVISFGLAPVMHAIGDSAVGKAMSAIGRSNATLLARVEHAQCISQRDLHTLSGNWFAVQPLHQPSDSLVGMQALGSSRANEMHNWRRMLDAGALLSFGSDWPVAPPCPIDGMEVAILCGVTPQEAIIATTSNAGLSLQSEDIGHLREGAMGDVVVLDQNPLHCDWKLHKPSVTMTIQAGNVVYTKGTCFE